MYRVGRWGMTAGRTTAAMTAATPSWRATLPKPHITWLSTSVLSVGVRRLATVVDQRWTRPRPCRATRISHITAPMTKNHGEREDPPLAAAVRNAASSGSPATPGDSSVTARKSTRTASSATAATMTSWTPSVAGIGAA
jgi:hypothetical protein